MSISLHVDPVTLQLTFDDDGQVELDDGAVAAVLLAVAVPVNTFAGDADLGSRVPLLIAGDPEPNVAAAIEDAVRAGLSRLVARGAITSPAIAVSVTGGRVDVTIDTDELPEPVTVALET